MRQHQSVEGATRAARTHAGWPGPGPTGTAALCTLLLWLSAGPALAVDPAPFRPALGSSDLLLLEGAGAEPGPFVGLVLHTENDPLTASRDGRQQRVLGDRLAADLGLAYGIAQRLTLSLVLPVWLQQRSYELAAGAARSTSEGPGDLTAGARWTLHAPPAGGAGGSLALAARVRLPTASAGDWRGEDSPEVTLSLLAERRLVGGLRLGLQGAWRSRPREEVAGLAFDDELQFGLGAEQPLGIYRLALLGEAVAALGLGRGSAVGVTDAEDRPLELLAGLRWRPCGGPVLTAGYGQGVGAGYGSSDWRALLALGWGFGPANDPSCDAGTAPAAGALLASCDATSTAPSCAPGAPPAVASPPPPVPALPPPPEPAAALLAFDTLVAADPDPDGDGLGAPADSCPAEPEDRDGTSDDDGCPDPDDDGDGVADALDRCPTEREVVNGVADDDGCPDDGPVGVRVTAEKLEIDERIFFRTASDVLQDRSRSILEQIARTLLAHTALRQVRIEGHTDDQGDPEMNVDLSERRARRVAAFLVERGVAGERLQTRGFGPSRPVGSNATAAGRGANRRVEFVLLPGVVDAEGVR